MVLLGATGFVGALTAEHLARHAPAGTRVALAGRSRDRLERLRADLPPGAAGWDLHVVDVTDRPALDRLAASTAVLVSTVGPYARHGLPVVEACAAAGTHYADLTGELRFVRAAIDRTDAVARSTGARLVHACGYDSVPSDLGVHVLHAHARDTGAGDLLDVRALATARGGVSGGTVDSLRGELDARRDDPAAAALGRDPFALSPDRPAEPATPQPSSTPPPGRVAGRWTAPFVMAPFNTRVVRRSNALTGWSYGRGLRYGEVVDAGTGPVGALTAAGVTAGSVLLVAAMRGRWTRPLVDRLLPAPGEGPGADVRAAGWFRHRFLGTTTSGRTLVAEVSGPGDPGYAATAVMLGQTALAMALDDDLPPRAGSLTPATALGDALVRRLRAQGFTLRVRDAPIG
ncbi:saccharopine dehydrogenase family protein [Cellulomonas endophytica]|uniref:saccharopine dehydrogenase family protein n=1 Tax=Cellulomonas endophytica TaxID=2494735 RepID=UPI001F0BFA9E|nr:saccharopine dehydrogenase NADP-binding domain-containing protein [Cellulomonas endophytica]